MKQPLLAPLCNRHGHGEAHTQVVTRQQKGVLSIFNHWHARSPTVNVSQYPPGQRGIEYEFGFNIP